MDWLPKQNRKSPLKTQTMESSIHSFMDTFCPCCNHYHTVVISILSFKIIEIKSVVQSSRSCHPSDNKVHSHLFTKAAFNSLCVCSLNWSCSHLLERSKKYNFLKSGKPKLDSHDLLILFVAPSPIRHPSLTKSACSLSVCITVVCVIRVTGCCVFYRLPMFLSSIERCVCIWWCACFELYVFRSSIYSFMMPY